MNNFAPKVKVAGASLYWCLLILVLIVVPSIWLYHTHQQPIHPVYKETSVVVVIKTTKVETWHEKISITGNVFALEGTMLKAQVYGNIIGMYAKPSKWVAKGTLLFKIDAKGMDAEVSHNKAQLEFASEIHKAMADLYKDGTISSESYQKSISNYLMAEANYNKAKKLLDLTEIRAPFAGRLGLPLVRLGYFVNIGEKLIGIHNTKKMSIDFHVPSRYIQGLHLGQNIDIHSESFPKKIFKGVVYGINSHVDNETRSVMVRASILNLPLNFLPGMYGRTTVMLKEKIAVISVPETALKYSSQGVFVYRVKDGVAIETPVIVGIRKGQNVQIKSGIEKGESIVVQGLVKIHDGTKVVGNS